MLLAELAQLHEQGEALVPLLFLGRAVEQPEGVHFLRFGVNLAILAERGMEGLQLHDGLLFQFDVVVHASRGIEVVDVDARGDTTDAVQAANALHEAGGIPGRVVVHDDVGPVQVDALGQDFRGKENVEIVGPFGGVAVEIGADHGHPLGAGVGTDGQDALVACLGESAQQVTSGLLRFGEDDQFVALVIDLPVAQLRFEVAEEFVELGVLLHLFPFLAEGIELLPILLQAGDEPRLEISGGANLNGGIRGLALGDFGNEFLLAILEKILGDVQIGCDVDGALGEHLAHDGRGIPEAAEGPLEGVKAAVQALDQHGPHDEGQLGGHAVGVLVFALLLGLEEADGAVAIVGERGLGILPMWVHRRDARAT